PNTPDRNQGFALGLIMAAVSAGQTAGNYCGGMCAKYFGPVVSFKVGGVMLAISTILVVGWVKESFARPPVLPAPSQSARIRRRRDGIRSFKAGLPILGVVCLVSFLQVFDSPYLSLYIDSLYRIPVLSAVARGLAVSGGWGTEMVSTVDDALTSQVYGITGWVSAIASIAAMAGSIAAGKIMDRRLPVAVWLLLAAGGVAGALVCGTVPTMVGMVVGRSFFLFIVSGLASAVIVVLGRMTPNAKRGAAMGWSQTARSIGWSVSPLLGAFTAQRFGWDAAYLLLAVSSCLLLPCFWYLHRRYALAFQPLDDDLPSMGMVGGSHVAAPGGQGRL
ncbi:MAG: MFS transporter, partial [Planctomycetes bacterium]|nr:MFS transporter [Planctomycetota bacterium]